MDNKYASGKIYKLTSKQTDNIYIGSTIQTLTRRLLQHKYDIKRGYNNSSKEILKYDDVRIELIEEYPCNIKKELHTRERYYIENTPNTINKFIPTRTNLEYKKDNPEIVKKSRQKYKENNREKLRLDNKKYRENNREKISLSGKKYREDNREKIKLTDKKYKENNRDRITATRHYQNTWCGNFNHNNHNNLLRIDPKLFEN